LLGGCGLRGRRAELGAACFKCGELCAQARVLACALDFRAGTRLFFLVANRMLRGAPRAL